MGFTGRDPTVGSTTRLAHSKVDAKSNGDTSSAWLRERWEESYGDTGYIRKDDPVAYTSVSLDLE